MSCGLFYAVFVRQFVDLEADLKSALRVPFCNLWHQSCPKKAGLDFKWIFLHIFKQIARGQTLFYDTPMMVVAGV
jgi:hypothetical protein